MGLLCLFIDRTGKRGVGAAKDLKMGIQLGPPWVQLRCRSTHLPRGYWHRLKLSFTFCTFWTESSLFCCDELHSKVFCEVRTSILTLWMTILRAWLHKKEKKREWVFCEGRTAQLPESFPRLCESRSGQPAYPFLYTNYLFHFLCSSFSHVMSWQRGGFQISSQNSHNSF